MFFKCAVSESNGFIVIVTVFCKLSFWPIHLFELFMYYWTAPVAHAWIIVLLACSKAIVVSYFPKKVKRQHTSLVNSKEFLFSLNKLDKLLCQILVVSSAITFVGILYSCNQRTTDTEVVPQDSRVSKGEKE